MHTAVGATSAPMAAKDFLPSGRRWHTAVGESRLAAVGVGNVCWGWLTDNRWQVKGGPMPLTLPSQIITLPGVKLLPILFYGVGLATMETHI